MTIHRSLIYGLIALIFTGPAFGHAVVRSSSPANKSVGPAPKSISLTFSEKLVPAFSGFDLSMPHMKVPLVTSLSKDGKTIRATPPKGSMMTGVYKIHWHAAAADDGHHTEGNIIFTVK
jgi:methionine-rich copper-binding protein CopC